MRPDERLLVPVECLPFVPAGIPMWDDEFSVACIAGATAMPPNLHDVGLFVDISAPALRDGVPERLDVLPWALGVLGWHWVNGYESMVLGSLELGLPRWPSQSPDEADLSGLTNDEAARAVVAAALRQRGGK